MRKFLSSHPKWVVFALAGLLGAALFNAVFEILFPVTRTQHTFVAITFFTGAWVGFFSAGIALALFTVQRALLGAEEYFWESFKPLGIGFALGGVSGAAAQIMYSMSLSSGINAWELPRIIAWAMAGGGLGLALSLAVPNLQPLRAFLFGALGGFAGSLGFLLVGYFFNDIGARLVGTGIIGLFVGLSVAVAEATAKEGYLRVVWGPGEYTRVNLGSKPVLVGSSRESTVRMASSAGYPPIVATFSLQNGQATMVNHMSRTTHVLRNGNKLTLGSVVIEIHLFA